MSLAPTPIRIELTDEERRELERIARGRLTVPTFADLDDLVDRITAFIAEWNAAAHPFKWSQASVAKILANVDAAIAAANPPAEAAA
jgi:hypothetical protein